MMVQIVKVESAAQIATTRELFREYADQLGFDLGFQNFEQELAFLPGDYAPPHGCLLLAEVDGFVAGCVALHQSEGPICEMKRLYARPACRGQGVGRALAQAAIEEARRMRYKIMRLDTVAPSMKEAVQLYRALGFREIPPYRVNPQPGTIFMEVEL